MGTNYYLVENRPSRRGGLLIGKDSLGWEFSFNKPKFKEIGRELNNFEQWRDCLKEETETEKHVIVNQYDEIIPYDDFIKMVEESYKFRTIGE